MSKILLADDEDNLREAVTIILQRAGYEVVVAADGTQAVERFVRERPDLVILDVMMPWMDGYQACERIRVISPDAPVLMLTAKGDIVDKKIGFHAGADDYMVKPFDFRELNARIKVLLKRVSGNVPELPQELVYADLRIDLQRKDVERNNVPIKLSPKEYNLLLYMVENAEKVLSRVEIAEKVWNTHFDTGTNFIDVYINYLRKKIDRNFEPKLIHTKAGMGFILTDKL